MTYRELGRRVATLLRPFGLVCETTHEGPTLCHTFRFRSPAAPSEWLAYRVDVVPDDEVPLDRPDGLARDTALRVLGYFLGVMSGCVNDGRA